MIASQPLEGYVSRVVSGVMAAIAAYWAMRLMSPLWTVLAVLVGLGVVRPVDYGTAKVWWLYLALYLGSAAIFLWNYGRPPREPGDLSWLMAAGCSLTLWVNLLVGRFRGTWSFLRSR